MKYYDVVKSIVYVRQTCIFDNSQRFKTFHIELSKFPDNVDYYIRHRSVCVMKILVVHFLQSFKVSIVRPTDFLIS